MRSSLLILAGLSIAIVLNPHSAVAAAPRMTIGAVAAPTGATETAHPPAEHDSDDHAAGHTPSRWPLILAGLYCLAIVLASLAGGWLPLIVRLTHTRLQLSMSLCGGLMLGIGLLHMLPHSVAVLGSLDRAVGWMMAGLLTMFFLIRAFHFHQHEPASLQQAGPEHSHGSEPHHHGHAHHHPPKCN